MYQNNTIFRSPVWNEARRLDILGTSILRNEYLKECEQSEKTGGRVLSNPVQYELACNHFESAFDCYNAEVNNNPSPQIYFEFAGFCWAMCGDGPCICGLEPMYHRCAYKHAELMKAGLTQYPDNKKLLFLKRYELLRYGFDITKDDILETVDSNNPGDTPYFLLFLMEDFDKKYLNNIKILWEECSKEITLFNRLVISLIEYYCDPKLIDKNVLADYWAKRKSIK
jgi:hypothetical protein